MENADLVRRMMADDPEALEELMKGLQKDIFRMAYLISGNYADSEDIVQETFVQVYLKRKNIREPEAFKTWVIRMMTRIAWRYLKKARREQPQEDFPREESGGESLWEKVQRKEDSKELYKAILDLPVKQRTAVILYYFEGLTAREIASVSGCLEGTVKSRLHTARKRLKEKLEGGGLPEERRDSV